MADILNNQDLGDLEGLTVTTDQPDYAPGSTATFTVSGVTSGGTVTLAVADRAGDPGDAPLTVVDARLFVHDRAHPGNH